MWIWWQEQKNYVPINMATWSVLEAQTSADLLHLHGLLEKQPDESFSQTFRVETVAHLDPRKDMAQESDISI